MVAPDKDHSVVETHDLLHVDLMVLETGDPVACELPTGSQADEARSEPDRVPDDIGRLKARESVGLAARRNGLDRNLARARRKYPVATSALGRRDGYEG